MAVCLFGLLVLRGLIPRTARGAWIRVPVSPKCQPRFPPTPNGCGLWVGPCLRLWLPGSSWRKKFKRRWDRLGPTGFDPGPGLGAPHAAGSPRTSGLPACISSHRETTSVLSASHLEQPVPIQKSRFDFLCASQESSRNLLTWISQKLSLDAAIASVSIAIVIYLGET